jgi:hypothetical protein
VMESGEEKASVLTCQEDVQARSEGE